MRRKVAVVYIMNCSDVFAHLEKTFYRVEYRFQIIGISHRPVDLVAQTIVKRETRLYFPIILGVEPHAVLCDMAMSVAEAAIGKVSFAQEQLLNIVLRILAIAVVPRSNRSVGAEVADCQSGAGFVPNAVGIGALEISSQLDGMISFHPGEMFGPIVGSVWPRGQRIALNSSDIPPVSKVIHVHVWNSKIGSA